MDWYIMYADDDDANYYLSNDCDSELFCKNKECHRPLVEVNDLPGFPKSIKNDYQIVSSMGLVVVSSKFISLLGHILEKDVCFKQINKNVYIMSVMSIALIRDEFVRVKEYCPVCKNPMSRTYREAFVGKGVRLFVSPEKNDSVMCRTSDKMGNSHRPTYDIFIRDDVYKLMVGKLKGIIYKKCIDLNI